MGKKRGANFAGKPEPKSKDVTSNLSSNDGLAPRRPTRIKGQPWNQQINGRGKGAFLQRRP